ncbi:DsbA family protein [Tunturiibacter gelidoferens]|uniref:Protein-disulfide isomerase n=1 Tax=Tunturiibacter gelidiferens TaxID=3069689 RepID=A0ACC5P0X7_9BACT|nr:thioredoxin domain-containing protein [Edaphobacter lichenicola]MBB5340296.1 protein-disulfide isomerase [Edaphobacter lichenicola]
MRLITMNRIVLAAALLLALPAIPALAQGFKDTSMLRAPAGSPVAIYEFEDLECPACSHAFPIVHAAVDKYKIPLLRHDFPLRMHVWSFDAAVIARYIQDKISPQAAEEYRRAVFANQISIASKEDLNAFTQKYFQSHGRVMPFVIDPNGLFAAEVHADQTLGERVGLTKTPTIFIVTHKGFVEVNDVTQLYAMLDTAIAENPAPASAKPKTTTAKR